MKQLNLTTTKESSTMKQLHPEAFQQGFSKMKKLARNIFQKYSTKYRTKYSRRIFKDETTCLKYLSKVSNKGFQR